MANTITITTGLAFYYILVGLVVTLLSMGGAFDDRSVSTTAPEMSFELGATINKTELPTNFVSSFGVGDTLKDLFSFFVFNISFNEGAALEWLWLIRVIFVYFPALILTLGVAFFIRGTS